MNTGRSEIVEHSNVRRCLKNRYGVIIMVERKIVKVVEIYKVVVFGSYAKGSSLIINAAREEGEVVYGG